MSKTDKLPLTGLGAVVYTETAEGLTAKWLYKQLDNVMSGRGVATRTTPKQALIPFEGQYQITYFDESDNHLVTLALTIAWQTDHYQVTWQHVGRITETGVGFLHEKQLFVSYSELPS